MRAAQTISDVRECNQALFRAARINKRAGVFRPGDEGLRKAYDALKLLYSNLQNQIDVQNPHLCLDHPDLLRNPLIRRWYEIELASRDLDNRWREGNYP
jgi:hypothetical protein